MVIISSEVSTYEKFGVFSGLIKTVFTHPLAGLLSAHPPYYSPPPDFPSRYSDGRTPTHLVKALEKCAPLA